MFRKLVKNKRAQNTAEYAILISLVVAGIIAMQTYAQRALQAKVRDSVTYTGTLIGNIAGSTNYGDGVVFGSTRQYEPYYLSQEYIVSRDESSTEIQDNTQISMGENSYTNRAVNGFQQQSYNADLFVP